MVNCEPCIKKLSEDEEENRRVKDKPEKSKNNKEELVEWADISHKACLQRELLHSNNLHFYNLFRVPMVLSEEECNGFIMCAENRGLKNQGSRPPEGDAFRDNERLADHNPELAERLWQAGMSELFHDIVVEGKVAVGLNPNIRVYKYEKGQRFGPHYDASVYMDGGGRTEYTLLVYLTGGLDGGETVFYERKGVVAQVAPVAGMALFHIHGARCLLEESFHEAKAVTKGLKYVLRSDVVFA